MATSNIKIIMCGAWSVNAYWKNAFCTIDRITDKLFHKFPIYR
jgi:hypothetical protein